MERSAKVKPAAPPSSTDQDRLALFQQHRRLLYSIAYRMLGTVSDAEDQVQEAFLRWQQTAIETIESPKAFLITVVSRLCINHLQSARVRREEYVGQWLPEPIVTDPTEELDASLALKESLSIAFLILLECLNPTERAVFLLHEVFDVKHAEIAKIVNQSEAHCRQTLRRARQRIDDGRRRYPSTREEQERLLEQFLRATRVGSVAALSALLDKDVSLQSDGGGRQVAAMNVIHGAEGVSRAIVGGLAKLVPNTLVSKLVQINGTPGFISYKDGEPFAAMTFDSGKEGIRAIYFITNPRKLSHLPVPPDVAATFEPGAHHPGGRRIL